VLNSIRYLGMNDFAEIGRMTLYEYDMRMTAYRLRQVDREYEIHLQAWLNWNVQAMKKKGKHKRVPVFKTFRQFFDHKKCIRDILEGESEEGRLARAKKQGIVNLLRKQKEGKRAHGNL